MLTLHEMRREYNGQALFENLGVTVLPGCLLHIYGANGSGKSELLRMVAGKSPVAKGHISFAQQETRGDAEFFADIFYLPQEGELPKRWRLEKYVMKQAKEAGQPELAEAALHYLGLEEYRQERLGELTPGLRQRARLTALVCNPVTIWLLDNPFNGLDNPTREKVEELIATRCKQNGIVLLVNEAGSRLRPHHVLDLTDFAP